MHQSLACTLLLCNQCMHIVNLSGAAQAHNGGLLRSILVAELWPWPCDRLSGMCGRRLQRIWPRKKKTVACKLQALGVKRPSEPPRRG
eukprot:SAG11_NODE_1799_length_4244_cov_2.524005_5_plen_88_part_00